MAPAGRLQLTIPVIVTGYLPAIVPACLAPGIGVLTLFFGPAPSAPATEIDHGIGK